MIQSINIVEKGGTACCSGLHLQPCETKKDFRVNIKKTKGTFLLRIYCTLYWQLRQIKNSSVDYKTLNIFLFLYLWIKFCCKMKIEIFMVRLQHFLKFRTSPVALCLDFHKLLVTFFTLMDWAKFYLLHLSTLNSPTHRSPTAVFDVIVMIYASVLTPLVAQAPLYNLNLDMFIYAPTCM